MITEVIYQLKRINYKHFPVLLEFKHVQAGLKYL